MNFDNSGSKLVTASGDGTSRVYDMNTFMCSAILIGHNSEVSKALFNPQGTRILTASAYPTFSPLFFASEYFLVTRRRDCGAVKQVSVYRFWKGIQTRYSLAASTMRETRSSQVQKTTLVESGTASSGVFPVGIRVTEQKPGSLSFASSLQEEELSV